MGPVNPLALEELAALEERDRFLAEQLEDVRGARRELGRVIRAVDEEIVASSPRRSPTSPSTSRAFACSSQVVPVVWPGRPEDLLDTGSRSRPARRGATSGGSRCSREGEVARGPRLPLRRVPQPSLALLPDGRGGGGPRRREPHRFLALVDEFREEAQLIIVSHQKRTMEAADVLYGVTMARAVRPRW